MQSRNVRALALFLIFYVSFGALLTWQQERFIYLPSGLDYGDCPLMPNAELISHNTTRYYLSEVSSSTPIVVMYHGNAGSACSRGSYFTPLIAHADLSYLLVEYPGYGGDTEPPSHERMRQAVADTVEYLAEHSTAPVIVVGESVGSGLASWHIAEAPPDALILLTPLTTLSDVASKHYWFYPSRLLVNDVFDVPPAVANYRGPTLIIYGTADTITPPSLSEVVVEASGELTEVVVVDGAGHNDLFAYQQTRTAMTEFLLRFSEEEE